MESKNDSFLSTIVECIDFNKFIQVFDKHMFREILPRSNKIFENFLESTNDNKKGFVRYCLEKYLKDFISMLIHSGQYSALLLIDPSFHELIDSSRLDPINGRIISSCPYINVETMNDKLVKCDKVNFDRNDAYPMNKSPRGICLIVNNYFTIGTFKETQRFRNIFFQLHFKVIIENNLTAEDLKKKMLSLSKDMEHVCYDAFICLIITYGKCHGEIIGFDEIGINFREICLIFDNNNCPNMKGKPKIFILNFVRAVDGLPHNNNLFDFSIRIPLDFLICYSKIVSYDDWNSCTNFGKVLCDVFVHKGWNEELTSILKNMNRTLENNQVNWRHLLTKILIFNPSVPNIKELLY